jgi:hypothetical protein
MNCLRSSLSILKLDKFLFLFYRVENVMVLEEGQSPLTCLLKVAGTTTTPFFFIAAGWNGKVKLYKDICQLQR